MVGSLVFWIFFLFVLNTSDDLKMQKCKLGFLCSNKVHGTGAGSKVHGWGPWQLATVLRNSHKTLQKTDRQLPEKERKKKKREKKRAHIDKFLQLHLENTAWECRVLNYT